MHPVRLSHIVYDSLLSALPVSESDLSGSIPAELGNLTSLTDLWLRDNKLSGEAGILAIDWEICAAKLCFTDRICRSV